MTIECVREAIRDVLEHEGRSVQTYSTCEAFIEAYRPGGEACLLIDAYLPGMNGLELLRWLGHSGHRLPAIMITGNSDVPMAVQAMKAGAWDFIEKPIGHRELLEQRRKRARTVAEFQQAACLPGESRQALSPVSRRDNGRLWNWFWRVIPVKISPPTSASANVRLKIIVPRLWKKPARSRFQLWPVWRLPPQGTVPQGR